MWWTYISHSVADQHVRGNNVIHCVADYYYCYYLFIFLLLSIYYYLLLLLLLLLLLSIW